MGCALAYLCNTSGYETSEDLSDALIEWLAGVDSKFRIRWGFIRGGDSTEFGYLPCPRLLIETFHVALLADLERRIHKDLDEPTLRMLQVPELKRAMGFGDEYELPHGTRRDKIKLLGNGVCPQVMEAIVDQLIDPVITGVPASVGDAPGTSAPMSPVQ